jgi:hypothetical protein
MKNLNLNADFLLDIWADLKAKKLAPVAIGLVAVAVAMPALMLKSDDAAVTGPIPIAAPPVADNARVVVADELAGGSKLDSYKARDPFEGLARDKAPAATGGGSATAPSDALEEAGKVLSGGSSPLDSSGSSGSDALGGQGPGSDPSLPPAGTTPPPVIVRRPGSRFNFQLDLKVGRPGREKRYPSVARLTFLPSASLPALLFMGVTEDERSALFFVHPGLSHQGEGACLPSNANCNFLTLKIGQEHFLSADDHEFHITLLGIKRVKLSAEKAQREQVRKASRRSARSNGEAGMTGDSAEGEFEMPFLVDGVG